MTGQLYRATGWGLVEADLRAHITVAPSKRGPASALTRTLRALPAADFAYPDADGPTRNLLDDGQHAPPRLWRPEKLVTAIADGRRIAAVVFFPDLAHRRQNLRAWPSTATRTVADPPTLIWLDGPAAPESLRWYLRTHGLIDAAGIAKLRALRAQWEVPAHA